MSVTTWNDLLPNSAAIKAMNAEEMQATVDAIDLHGTAIGFGIAAIGHLLACTASNGETGLCKDAATDIGWLLQSLGTLSAKLADNRTTIDYHRKEAMQ